MEAYDYELAQRRIEDLRAVSERVRQAGGSSRRGDDARDAERLSAQLRLFFLQLGRSEAR